MWYLFEIAIDYLSFNFLPRQNLLLPSWEEETDAICIGLASACSPRNCSSIWNTLSYGVFFSSSLPLIFVGFKRSVHHGWLDSIEPAEIEYSESLYDLAKMISCSKAKIQEFICLRNIKEE